MNGIDKKKAYEALAAPFPEEAIQRTEGRVTGRGYNTSGIAYQWIINRLNEVLGLGGWRAHRTVTVKEITTAKGRQAFESICDLTLELGEWVDGQFVCWAEALADGGHVSTSEADARKGAYTNALKKGAAMFGVGRQAYEGTLDDDNVPGVEAPQYPAQQQGEARSSPRDQPRAEARSFTMEQARAEAQRAPRVEAQGFQREPQRGPVQEPTTPVPPVAPADNGGRNRLTSKQLAALWSLARRNGLSQSEFRAQVRGQFGVQPEFLGKAEASKLIGAMSNGHADATEAIHAAADGR